jgi:hypothetical protein
LDWAGRNEAFAASLKHPATYSHTPDLRQLANGLGIGGVGAGRENLYGNGYAVAMRQGQNNKNRMRGRNSSNNPRKGGGSRNQSYESNGPDVKVRGNAQQVVEKYLTLARDAMLSGDRIDAESYYQFAEHYYRIMNANAANEQQRQQQNPSNDQQGGDNGQNNQNADNGNRGGDQQADADDSPRSGRRGPADKSGDAETDDSAEASESDSEVLEAAATTDDNAGEASRPRRRSSRGGTRRKKESDENAKADDAGGAVKIDSGAEKQAAKDAAEDAEESARV